MLLSCQNVFLFGLSATGLQGNSGLSYCSKMFSYQRDSSSCCLLSKVRERETEIIRWKKMITNNLNNISEISLIFCGIDLKSLLKIDGQNTHIRVERVTISAFYTEVNVLPNSLEKRVQVSTTAF